jgi:ADP-ribose pyrophosphatase
MSAEKPHGPWKIKSTEQAYVDPFVEVTVDQVVRPDGADGQHVVVRMKPGVCVIAVDRDAAGELQVHLTREFHYGVGRDSLEGASGGIEPGEDPDETARRELAEELGLEADCWELLTTVDPFTTIMVSPTRLYLAAELSTTDTNPEGTELIEHVVVPLAMAVAQVAEGKITHAPTCVALLLIAQKFASL